jgi:hypothetical protein
MQKPTKRIILTIMILVLALPTIAAAGASSNRIKFGETVDFSQGRAGVSFTNSQYTGTVKLAKGNQNNAPGENRPQFVQRLVNINLYKPDGERVKWIVGPVYAFFKVRQAEARAYERDDLTIYFYDTWTGEWTPCYTIPVYKGGKIDRLSCRMRVFGLYGLGLK